MKKIYSILGAVLISASSFAQSQFIGKAVANPLGYKSTAASRTAAAAEGDTVTWYCDPTDFIPTFGGTNQSVTRFGYTGGGSVFGKNVAGLNICAQGYYNLNATPLVITKALFSAYEKTMTSGNPASNVKVKLYSMAANKAWNESAPSATTSAQNSFGPNALLSSVTLSTSDVDTTTTPSQIANHFTIATFSVPVVVTGDFCVAVDCSGLVAGDTLGILADYDGGANQADLCFHYFNSKWYVTDYLFGGLDADVAIFAVLGTGTAVKEYVNGVKLSDVFPNPAIETATIQYSLEKNANNVSLVILDANGRKVFEEKYNSQASGNYSVKLNTSSYAAGSYFYQIHSNGKVITKEFVVTK